MAGSIGANVYAHIFIDEERVLRKSLRVCPRVGDTLRYFGAKGDEYAKVTEVIWCLNEPHDIGDRVNIRASAEVRK